MRLLRFLSLVRHLHRRLRLERLKLRCELVGSHKLLLALTEERRRRLEAERQLQRDIDRDQLDVKTQGWIFQGKI